MGRCSGGYVARCLPRVPSAPWQQRPMCSSVNARWQNKKHLKQQPSTCLIHLDCLLISTSKKSIVDLTQLTSHQNTRCEEMKHLWQEKPCGNNATQTLEHPATTNLADPSGLFTHFDFKEICCRPHKVNLPSEYPLWRNETFFDKRNHAGIMQLTLEHASYNWNKIAVSLGIEAVLNFQHKKT